MKYTAENLVHEAVTQLQEDNEPLIPVVILNRVKKRNPSLRKRKIYDQIIIQIDNPTYNTEL